MLLNRLEYSLMNNPVRVARGFRRETGMTFGAWRQHLRLLRSLELPAAGEPATTVALDVGYDSPSAFIRLFKASFGVRPSRYWRRSERETEPG